MNEEIVDYQAMIAKIAEENGKFRTPEVPEILKPCSHESVDYMAISKWWETQKIQPVANGY